MNTLSIMNQPEYTSFQETIISFGVLVVCSLTIIQIIMCLILLKTQSVTIQHNRIYDEDSDEEDSDNEDIDEEDSYEEENSKEDSDDRKSSNNDNNTNSGCYVGGSDDVYT